MPYLIKKTTPEIIKLLQQEEHLELNEDGTGDNYYKMRKGCYLFKMDSEHSHVFRFSLSTFTDQPVAGAVLNSVIDKIGIFQEDDDGDICLYFDDEAGEVLSQRQKANSTLLDDSTCVTSKYSVPVKQTDQSMFVPLPVIEPATSTLSEDLKKKILYKPLQSPTQLTEAILLALKKLKEDCMPTWLSGDAETYEALDNFLASKFLSARNIEILCNSNRITAILEANNTNVSALLQARYKKTTLSNYIIQTLDIYMAYRGQERELHYGYGGVFTKVATKTEKKEAVNALKQYITNDSSLDEKHGSFLKSGRLHSKLMEATKEYFGDAKNIPNSIEKLVTVLGQGDSRQHCGFTKERTNDYDLSH